MDKSFEVNIKNNRASLSGFMIVGEVFLKVLLKYIIEIVHLAVYLSL